MACTVEQFLDNARRFVGYNEFDGSYLEILKIYNSHKPLARGYAIRPGDSWCDAFVSAIAIKSNAVDIIGTEVSCELHRDIFVNKKIWNNNNTLMKAIIRTPSAGGSSRPAGDMLKAMRRLLIHRRQKRRARQS